jgi:hypothetical protein
MILVPTNACACTFFFRHHRLTIDPGPRYTKCSHIRALLGQGATRRADHVNYWKNKTQCLDGTTRPSGVMGTEGRVGRVQEAVWSPFGECKKDCYKFWYRCHPFEVPPVTVITKQVLINTTKNHNQPCPTLPGWYISVYFFPVVTFSLAEKDFLEFSKKEFDLDGKAVS